MVGGMENSCLVHDYVNQGRTIVLEGAAKRRTQLLGFLDPNAKDIGSRRDLCKIGIDQIGAVFQIRRPPSFPALRKRAAVVEDDDLHGQL